MSSLLLLLVACTDPAPPVAVSRVDAVAAAPAVVESPADFCDSHHPGADAPRFEWPVLDEAAPAQPATWRWVDVWATWCGPCIAEMPMIGRWRQRLAAEGVAVDFQLVSVDVQTGDVRRHYAKDPAFPPTVRVASFDAVPAWFGSLGVPETTAIPLSVFVDPEGRVRCSRAGALSEHDYGSVKRVLSGG